MSGPKDFQARFCRLHAVEPEHYAGEVLKRSVYTHARWGLWVLGKISDNYLQADYDFIYDVGRITRFHEYEQAVKSYFEHPMNQNNLLRSRLLLRISSMRMRRLVREVMKQSPPASTLS